MNQYRDARFDVCEYDSIPYCTLYGHKMGEYSLNLFGVPSEKDWVLLGLLFLAFAYVVFMTLSYFVLEFYRYESPENVSLDPEHDHNHLDMSPATSTYELAETPRSTTARGDTVTIKMDELDGKREKSFVPVALAFKDLWYSVPVPGQPKQSLDLLEGISGFALPSAMTA